MPETRYIKRYRYPEDLPAEDRTIDNAIIEYEPYEISDEQVEDEAEAQAFARADELIDAINSIADARKFLKRLVKRLIRKGAIP